MTVRTTTPLEPARLEPARLRSMLFVPASRPDQIAKALTSGADAVIIDLEDAVVDADKGEARANVVRAIETHAASTDARGTDARGADAARADAVPRVFVRINAVSTAEAFEDLSSVVRPGLTGVLVPKTESETDVLIVDRILASLERERAITERVLVCPILETAAALLRAYEIAQASPRVAYLGALAVRGGDIEASLGYRWTRSGLETLGYRSHVLLAVRAAGIAHPVSGLWTDVGDLDGLRDFAIQTRDLGYEGMMAIHPAHIPVINEVFTATEEEILHFRRVVDALRDAEVRGVGAAILDGHMIDSAMARRAELELARNGRKRG